MSGNEDLTYLLAADKARFYVLITEAVIKFVDQHLVYIFLFSIRKPTSVK